MNIRMYVCIYVCMCGVCSYVCMCVFVYVYMYVWMYVWMYVYSASRGLPQVWKSSKIRRCRKSSLDSPQVICQSCTKSMLRILCILLHICIGGKKAQKRKHKKSMPRILCFLF